MQYTILIYESKGDMEKRKNPAEAAAYRAGWTAYTKTLTDAGVKVGGAGLEPPDLATTVRLRNGERLVQDGPYADTKEQLGGYYNIEVPDLDTALKYAAMCPAAPNGVIEVRPHLQMPASATSNA
ncbi:MAG TPA: YciI family protein [Bryobacteraceae bacterium]|jgi:hypothetical protein|nr:YciI family protein [Bryobacteraceae bacterium]